MVKISTLTVGILALQGAFDLHHQTLASMSSHERSLRSVLVKTPDDLAECDGLILPGGESTVMKKLLISSELDQAIVQRSTQGMPILGTCAGLILLSDFFHVLDCTVERNYYGRQVNSFETDVECVPTGESGRAFFIRAPKITDRGTCDEFARTVDEIVGVMHGDIMGISCHPEVAGTTIFHEYFVDRVARRVQSL